MIYEVNNEDIGARLDSFVAARAEMSRSAAAKLIDSGSVTVNGSEKPKKYTVCSGDSVEVFLPEPEEYSVEAEDIPINVIYEDNDIIVINKPSGMVVHPAPGNYSGTLVNALLYHCRDSLSGIGGVMRPGIVHRIDKDTSGLLVVAKNDDAHNALSSEMQHHGIVREYHALVFGGFADDKGTVNYPIGRHPTDRKKMAVIRDGSHSAKEAVTHYEVVTRYGQITHLKLFLETGRTHQIRVHMSYIGHPLLGDEVYSSVRSGFEREHKALFDGQALHARALTLTHPRTKERMTFECDFPDNFVRMIEILNSQN